MRLRWLPALLLAAVAFAQEDIDDLLDDLLDDDVYVCELARAGLAKLGRKVVPHLIAALSSDNPRLRQEAAMTLGAIGKDAAEALPALAKLLRDKDLTVMVVAEMSIDAIRAKIGPAPAKNFALLAAGPRTPLLSALRGNDPLGPATVVVPQLLKIMETRDDALKAAAGKAFARYGKDARFATPRLISMGRAAAWSQRFAVVDALVAIGPPVCGPLLKAWSSCRSWAPQVCFRLEEGVIATALPALAGPDKQVRAAACDMIGAARSRVGAQHLATALHDKAGSVRRRAALALGGMGTDAVPPLVLLASDPARRAQREAVVALRQIVLEAAAVHRTSVRLASSMERKAVARGLAWLTDNQEATGAWDSGRHGGGAAYTPGVTGIALLALLEGEPDPKHRGAIEAGLRYLVAAQDAEGCFGPRKSQHFLYNHAAAALAMCVAYGQQKNPTYQTAAQHALDFIAAAQSPGAGWRYVPGGNDSDTSLTGWMVHALRRGLLAGLDVDAKCFSGALDYLDKVTADNGRIGYQVGNAASARPQAMVKSFPSEVTRAMTSSGAFALYQAGSTPSLATVKACLTFPPKWQPGSGQLDMYYWYHATRLLHHVGGGSFRRWAKPLKKALVSGQAKDGSWDPVGPWGSDGGRVYSTALMALCLKALDGKAQPVRFKTPPARTLLGALAVLRNAQRHDDAKISAPARNAISALR